MYGIWHTIWMKGGNPCVMLEKDVVYTYLYIYIYTWHLHTYVHMYVYIYIWCPPCTYIFCVRHFLYLFSREIGGTFLGIGCLPFVCVLVLLVLWEMGEQYLVLIRAPTGIGSNTRVLDPIPEYSTSIPLQFKNQRSTGRQVQHFRHRKGLRCRAFPKKNPLHNWLFRCFRDSTAWGAWSAVLSLKNQFFWTPLTEDLSRFF